MSLVTSLEKQVSKFTWVISFLKKNPKIYRTIVLIKNHHLCHYRRNLNASEYPHELSNWYFSTTGTHLNLDNPRTFNEKIQWMKLYDSTPLKTKLADKYLVREWVAEKIGEEYLIPLFGVWDKFDDIDFDHLPKQFVLKANHGSGWNLIVRNKAELDKIDAKKMFDIWMNTNYAYLTCLELHYRDIIPKIIAEQYLENFESGDLSDYKIHCFGGTPMYIQYIGGRSHHDTKEIFFDTNWNVMDFTYTYPKCDSHPQKPDNFDRLLDLARCLSEGFAYVRVDFYVLDDGSFRFGELTFTPAGGADHWNPPEYDRILGDLIHLPESP